MVKLVRNSNRFLGRCHRNLPLSGTGYPIVNLSDLSTRALQFIGGGLFSRYCDVIGVRHAAIDELIAYIDSIAQSHDLYLWGENLCLLDVHGLGDLPPPEIASELPYEIGGEFHRAVESLVEIYMADHMGAVTDNPQRFTRELLTIVSKHGVSLPDLSVFVQPNGRRSFGDLADDETLQKWRAALRC